MRCLADFEVDADLSVKVSGDILNFDHPVGTYQLRLRAGESSDGEAAPHLRVELIFDASDLTSAKEVALDHLADALNFLSLVTGSRFEYRQLLKLVDWRPHLSERNAHVFASFDPDHEPKPLLSQKHLLSIQNIIASGPQSEIVRAMRWFRLGVASDSIEESFQFFWFAVEIVASCSKPLGKVHDKCPKCGGMLYCEACNDHPKHRPYPKQAIRELIDSIVGKKGKNFFNAFDKARNTRDARRLLQRS
jgi:hypothetical protein